jgi:hypothetical protein
MVIYYYSQITILINKIRTRLKIQVDKVKSMCPPCNFDFLRVFFQKQCLAIDAIFLRLARHLACTSFLSSSDSWVLKLMILYPKVTNYPHLICLLHQSLLRHVLFGSGDGGVMTVALLRLARVLVFVAGWSKNMFVIFISCRILCIGC